MAEEKNDKGKVWVYAVVLFTSAFIVLILTAISQIRFNKNIDEYRDQISNKEIEKSKFQLNLNSALEENSKLRKDYNELEEELVKVNSELEQYKKETDAIAVKSNEITKAYEYLILADNEYNNGNIVECAETLKTKIKPEFLSETGLMRYTRLIENSYKKAAFQLYSEGLKLYRKEKYNEAVDRLLRSVKLVDQEYFSDDCYYLLAYSEYNLGNKGNVRKYVELLIQKYPGSGYINHANDLLELIEK
jgi:TolA-binding protein